MTDDRFGENRDIVPRVARGVSKTGEIEMMRLYAPVLVGLLAMSAGWATQVVPHRIGAAEPNRPQRSRPNVVLLLTDDQRPDTIGAMGNNVIETPHLDRLARRGVVFRRAVAPYPICTPSRAEILSGCSSFENGVMDFGGRLDPQRVLWPQTMKAHGYRTWYVGKWHNDGRPTQRGFDATRGLYAGGGGRWAVDQVGWTGLPITGYRGWVFQDDEGRKYPERGVGLTPDISRRFADAAIECIRESKGEPFFVHVNFTAPHDPLVLPPGFATRYEPANMPIPPNFLPEHPFDHGNLKGRDEQLLPWPRTEFMVRELIARYYAVISHMDAQIGRILAALEEAGCAENTIVIFTSDHGLAVGSHGLRGKQNMYEHTIGVPLILAGPGIPRGRQSDAQVYLRELYPTVCELVGIPIPPTVTGQSFAAVIRGERDEHHEVAFAYFRNFQRMIRTQTRKLIYYPHLPRWQLFDLVHDPYETKDLADDPRYADELDRLKRMMKQQQEAMHDPLLEPRGTGE